MVKETFTLFMSKTFETLEKFLKAPKDSLIFLEGNKAPEGGHTYFYRDISMHGFSYCVGFRTDWPVGYEGYRFLLHLSIQEVCNITSDSEIFRQNSKGRGGRWAFDCAGRRWHSSETLAAQIYERICYHVFPWIHRCLGLDPFNLSSIADMAYEADLAEGMIVFQTGELDGHYKVYRIIPKTAIPFIGENERFVRKQLAGAGNNSLLFIRERADNQEQYCYKGYLIPLDGSSDRKKLFVSVLLKRGRNWILQINERPVLCVKHRDVFLPMDDLSPVKGEIDSEFGPGMSGKLSVVLDALHDQKHGTSVIFLNMEDRASQEMVDRLEISGRALRIEDIHIDEEGCSTLKETLKNISRVDGALICDVQTMCICYVNVIVDGLALTPGRRDCGARHNALESAIVNLANQDTSKKVKALAAIFSEDGGISCISASQCYKKYKEMGGYCSGSGKMPCPATEDAPQFH